MAYHIRRIDFSTGRARDVGVYVDHLNALVKLRELRAQRGHWTKDPVVHGIYDPATKVVTDRVSAGFRWALDFVDGKLDGRKR